MNIQLVDSLIQVIESLTPEENLLFQEKLAARLSYCGIIQVCRVLI